MKHNKSMNSMKRNKSMIRNRSLQIFMVLCGSCCMLSAPLEKAVALPQVESRTGQPVVRRGDTASRRENSPSMPETFHGHAPDPIEDSMSAASLPTHSMPAQSMPAQSNARSHSNVGTHSNIGTNANVGSHSNADSHLNKPRTPEQQRAARMTLTQMEALQREVAELRGLVEMQDHEIKQLKKTQQDLYKDLERRLNETGKAKAKSVQSVQLDPPMPNNKSTASKTATSKTKEQPKASQAKESLAKESQDLAASLPPENDQSGEMMVIRSSVDTEEQALIEEMVINAESKPGKPETKTLINPNTKKTADNAKDKPAQKTEKSLDKAAHDKTAHKGNPGKEDKAKQDPAVTASSEIGVIPTSKTVTASVTDNNTYQSAYNLIRTKKYPEATTALHDYLKRFPNGEQAANAHYWLGEIYMVQWQGDKSKADLLEKANQEFLNVVHQFPTHMKVSDSVLKLGLIELEKGNVEAARLHFSDVKTRFPGTAAAKVADARLQLLKN